jgi:ribosomal-protein-alanine N-acetyltransferase
VAISKAVSPTIRLMQAGDIPAVMDIDRLSFSLPWPERSYAFELGNQPVSHLLVAEAESEEGRQLVGYVGFWLIVDEAHISTLAVRPGWRGQGIGSGLLCAALQRAMDHGAEMATLEVRASNAMAIEMYTRHGFGVVGRRLHYYRDNDEDALLMTTTDLRAAVEYREGRDE